MQKSVDCTPPSPTLLNQSSDQHGLLVMYAKEVLAVAVCKHIFCNALWLTIFVLLCCLILPVICTANL